MKKHISHIITSTYNTGLYLAYMWLISGLYVAYMWLISGESSIYLGLGPDQSVLLHSEISTGNKRGAHSYNALSFNLVAHFLRSGLPITDLGKELLMLALAIATMLT